MKVSVYNQMHRQLMPIIKECILPEAQGKKINECSKCVDYLGEKNNHLYVNVRKAMIKEDEIKRILEILPRDVEISNQKGFKLSTLLPDGNNYTPQQIQQQQATINILATLVSRTTLR